MPSIEKQESGHTIHFLSDIVVNLFLPGEDTPVREFFHAGEEMCNVIIFDDIGSTVSLQFEDGKICYDFEKHSLEII